MVMLRIGLLLILATAGAAAQTTAPDSPGYARPGPYGVGSLESVLLGSMVEGNAVQARLSYPRDGAGPFPVVVFSHGLGADKDVYTALTGHWASHGFVVLQPSHDDAGVGFADGGMHPGEDKVRERLGNVLTVLDSLDRVAATVDALQGRLDRDSLAVAGHSYGSFITMLAGGLSVAMGGRDEVRLGPGGIACIIPISPSGRGDYGMHDGSFDSLDLPAMFFTGTEDRRRGRPADWRMEPFRLSPPGDKYQIVISGAAHGDFGGDTGSGAVNYVKAATTAFLDACLNGNGDGRAWLDRPEGFADWAGEQASIESR